MPKILKSIPIEHHIYIIRGHKVMVDSDLAELYQVETRALIQAVSRNAKRFPADFMFRLSATEEKTLRSQFVISSTRHGGRRHLPYAFTELGVAMLSSVLNSKRAIQMNIIIMRAFIRLREMVTTNKDFAVRIGKLEARQNQTTSVIDVLIDEIDGIHREVRFIKKLPLPSKRKIGFDL
jgi:hypothetical protein